MTTISGPRHGAPAPNTNLQSVRDLRTEAHAISIPDYADPSGYRKASAAIDGLLGHVEAAPHDVQMAIGAVPAVRAQAASDALLRAAQTTDTAYEMPQLMSTHAQQVGTSPGNLPGWINDHMIRNATSDAARAQGLLSQVTESLERAVLHFG